MIASYDLKEIGSDYLRKSSIIIVRKEASSLRLFLTLLWDALGWPVQRTVYPRRAGSYAKSLL
jgi:hypothetical protein